MNKDKEIKMSKFNLNIEYEGSTHIKIGKFIICNKAFSYIKSKSDLQKAWNDCKKASWIQYLLDMIELPAPMCFYDYVIHEKRKFKLCNYSVNCNIELLNRCNEEWCEIIKKHYPWKDIERELIRSNIIKSNDSI